MYRLLIITVLTLIATGCSSSDSSDYVEPRDTAVTIFGDSMCYSDESFSSWARRLDDVEGLNVSDTCIRGHRATNPIFLEAVINDLSDVFIMSLGVNDATGIGISEQTAKDIGITTQTIEEYRAAYSAIIGTALLNGSEVICVLPPLTGVAWVQPYMPQIWDVIIDVCGDVGVIVSAAPSDAADNIHYNIYGDGEMHRIMLEALST